MAPEAGAQEEECEHHDHAGGRIDGRSPRAGERHEVAHAEGADGRAVLLAMAGGAVVLGAMAAPSLLWAFALICLVWGIGGGVTLTQGRTIVQLEAPESHRARVLAIFQLGFAGGAPVGALGMGYLVALTGPRLAAIYPAAGMVVVLGFLIARSGLWRHTPAAFPRA